MGLHTLQYVLLKPRLPSSIEDSIIAFKDLQQYSIADARDIGQLLHENETPSTQDKTIALLCPSSVDFLFGWLALMRLGYSVLLIAYVESSTVWAECSLIAEISVRSVNHLRSCICANSAKSPR